MFDFKGRRVLVAGGTGLIGIPLVELLIDEGARVRIASLDDPSRAHPGAEFRRVNLLDFKNCMESCRDVDYVFNLLCVKGSPAVTSIKPASFLVPHLMFNTNLMEAARQCGAKGFLFTSSLAVYGAATVFYEDDVWKTFPSENDKFAGWAKRMGELQAEAYRIEYGWGDVSIVRPANVYGPYDNFGLENAMVIPSLIKRAVGGENPLRVWGDGSPIRDFIHAKDVARGMLLVAKSNERRPVNLGSGVGVSIRELVAIIVDNLGTKTDVVGDTSKASGDTQRVLDISRARDIGFQPSISLKQGIKETMGWFKENRSEGNKRYDVFARAH
jgi:GDP-L-fucose synthase